MPDKEERQTLMFSATFPSDVQDLARDFLNNYLFLSVGIVGGACDDVSQSFFQVMRAIILWKTYISQTRIF